MEWGSILTTVILTAFATVGVAFGLLKLYLSTFVKTTVEESVKHGFVVERQKMREDFEREQESRERKDKFRLAAIDERLRAHQNAYSLWREMLRTLHSVEAEKAPVNAK